MHFVLIVILQMLLKNGNYVRKLYFLNVVEQKCIIQKYECKKCGKIFFILMLNLLLMKIVILQSL